MIMARELPSAPEAEATLLGTMMVYPNPRPVLPWRKA